MTAFKPGDRVHLKGHAHAPATLGTVTRSAPDGRVFVQWDDGPAITPHLPQHLEPAGEPMSTFKSIYQKDLAVEKFGTSQITVTLGAPDEEPAAKYIFDRDIAPALALAILEAAGVKSAEPMRSDRDFFGGDELGAEYAVMWLRNLAKHNEEAADREELEAEALHLCRIMWDNPDQAWAPMRPEAKAKWLKMARKARELHGVTK